MSENPAVWTSIRAVRVVLSANFSETVHTPFALNVNGSAPLPVLFHVVAASCIEVVSR